MLNNFQFRQCIVLPTLYSLLMDSPDAEELLVFTCATESLGCTYIKQVEGPALGIYQMEPLTHNDLWTNYINYKSTLVSLLISNFDISRIPNEYRLVYDLRYATAMARIFYHRTNEPLPPHNDVDLIWEYYKKYYNTGKGAAEKDEAIKRYHDFIKA